MGGGAYGDVYSERGGGGGAYGDGYSVRDGEGSIS